MNTNLSIIKAVDNCFYDPNSNYVMGVDTGGKRFAICVMRKNNDGIDICYMGKGRDKVDFDNEVKMIAAFYHIPESQILKGS